MSGVRSGTAEALGEGGGAVANAVVPQRGVLGPEFYERPVLEVARELIGCVVERHGVCGMIVETEAYHESEPACHAFVGMTPRTRTLFGEAGVAYVYRSYGIHSLLNAVCEPVGVGAAVLIRALQPQAGIDSMRRRRGGVVDEQLCSGPGKLAQALGVELRHNATSLVDGEVRIWAGESLAVATVAGPRIGISKAVELPWRFCAMGNRHVSRPWPRPATRSG